MCNLAQIGLLGKKDANYTERSAIMAVLCFGTFFTLLCGNRKDWDKKSKPEVSNRVLYFALLDIVNKHSSDPMYHAKRARAGNKGIYSSDSVSVAKTCKNNEHQIQRLGNRVKYIDKFKKKHQDVLSDFSFFVCEYLDESQYDRLGRSIIELIKSDNEIDDEARFFICDDADYLTSKKIREETHGLSLPSLLAGILFYILNNNIPNGSDEAKATIKQWDDTYKELPNCPTGESIIGYIFNKDVSYTPGCPAPGFVGYIGNGGDKDIKLFNPHVYRTKEKEDEKKDVEVEKKKKKERTKKNKYIYTMGLCVIIGIIVLSMVLSSKNIPEETIIPPPFREEPKETPLPEPQDLPPGTERANDPPTRNPQEPNPTGYAESNFVPALSENQKRQFPLFHLEREISIFDYEVAKAVLQSAIFTPPDNLPVIAEDMALNNSLTYAKLAQTDDWHEEIMDNYANGIINTEEAIQELLELISQQERSYEYSLENLGGVGQGLLIIIARNYFELGFLYDRVGNYELAFTNYIKSIERYILCYQILIKEPHWNEDDIQAEYKINYWIAHVFAYIGDMGEVQRIFRANSFISSRSFYNLFRDNASESNHSRRLYAYSIYFAGHSTYKTALALMEENPATAINYAEAAIDYYAEYKSLAVHIQDQDFVSYCVIAIEQLNELLVSLRERL
jgi:tetratricopeptide (TPR) repeat protein